VWGLIAASVFIIVSGYRCVSAEFDDIFADRIY
jgi:hypothetical protein